MQDNANSDLGEAPPRHEVAVTCSAPQGQRAQDNNDATSEGIAPTHEEIDGTLRAYDRAGTQRSEERLDEQLRWLHQYIANARTPTAMQLRGGCNDDEYSAALPSGEARGTPRANDRAGTQRAEGMLNEQLRWLHQYTANAEKRTTQHLRGGGFDDERTVVVTETEDEESETAEEGWTVIEEHDAQSSGDESRDSWDIVEQGDIHGTSTLQGTGPIEAGQSPLTSTRPPPVHGDDQTTTGTQSPPPDQCAAQEPLEDTRAEGPSATKQKRRKLRPSKLKWRSRTRFGKDATATHSLERPHHTTREADSRGLGWIGHQFTSNSIAHTIRIATISAQGRLHTLPSLSGHLGRLDKYVAFMCRTAIDVLVVTHPGCTTSEAKSQLWSSLVAKAHMNTTNNGFKLFGPPSTNTAYVLIIVRGPWRAEVQATAQSGCGRILGITLARNAQRMAIFGFYGHTNAMRDEHKLRESTRLLRILQQQIEKCDRHSTQVILAGDWNISLNAEDAGPTAQDTATLKLRHFCELTQMESAYHTHLQPFPPRSTAYTYSWHGTGKQPSIIDHIFTRAGQTAGAGVYRTAGEELSDHRPLVCAVLCHSWSQKSRPPTQRLRERIFDAYSAYWPRRLRGATHQDWPDIQDCLQHLLREENPTEDAITKQWGRILATCRAIELKARKKPHPRALPVPICDKAAKRLHELLSRWARARQLIRQWKPGDRRYDLQKMRIQCLVTGPQRRAKLLEVEWNHAGLGAIWRATRLPRLRSGRSGRGRGEHFRNSLQMWAGTAREATKTMRALLSKRAKMWANIRRDLEYNTLKDELVDGQSGRMYKMVFRKNTDHQSMESMWVGAKCVTDPRELTQRAAKFMADLSLPTMWNKRRYDPRDLASTLIPAGPWQGRPRATELLLSVFNCQSWAPHAHHLSQAFAAPTFHEFLQAVRQGSPDSGPGITGISYGIMRMLPLPLQQLLHLITVIIITKRVVPRELVNLVIIALPKGSAMVGGMQGCRPISLYEVVLKIATGIVHGKMRTILHERCLLHDRQIFNTRHRGVQEALTLVLTAIGRSIEAGRPIYMASTDIKAAFPTVGHWFLRYVLEGKGAPPCMVEFYLLADTGGTFRMRVGKGYSQPHQKSEIGIGQGEKGSPEKYVISIDPILRYLWHYRRHGLWIGEGAPPKLPPGAHPLMAGEGADKWLVAILFCDDMFYVSGTAPGLQTLLHKAGEVYDFAGSQQVAYKSYAGASVTMPNASVRITANSGDLSAVINATTAWAHAHLCAGDDQRLLDWKRASMRLRGNTIVLEASEELLHALGDEIAWAGYTIKRDAPGTLVHALQADHWRGQISVRDRPFHFVDIRTGRRAYLQKVGPLEHFRYLGAQMTPALDWNFHRTKMRQDATSLINDLQRAHHSRLWSGQTLGMAANGKILGTLRFPLVFVPTSDKEVQRTDSRLATVLMSLHGLGYGVSPHQTQYPAPLGTSMPNIRSTQRVAFTQQLFSCLNSEREEGDLLRRSLKLYQNQLRSQVNPLAIPLHPLEEEPKGPVGQYWHQARRLLKSMQLSIDSPTESPLDIDAPWQCTIATRRITGNDKYHLQLLRRPQSQWRALTHLGPRTPEQYVQSLLGDKGQGKLFTRRWDKLRRDLRAWTLEPRETQTPWPRWRTLASQPIWTCYEVPRATCVEELSLGNYFVSDGTVQQDGTTAFAGCTGGQHGWVGRLHMLGSSYEAEVAGILEGLARGLKNGRDVIPTSDCRSALYMIRKLLRKRRSDSRLCLMAGSPLWAYLYQELFSEGLAWERRWTWTRAHVAADQIQDGTLTGMQDWCDRRAPDAVGIPPRRSDFYHHDTLSGMFDTTKGSLPGQRMRIIRDIPKTLKKHARGQGIPDTVAQRSQLHPDGSLSWRAMRDIELADLPQSCYNNPRFPFQGDFKFDVSSLQTEGSDHDWTISTNLLGTTTAITASRLRPTCLRRKATQARIWAIAGRLPTRAHCMQPEQLASGTGNCHLCNAQVADSQRHFFECTGDAAPVMARILKTAKDIRGLRHLHTLYVARLPAYSWVGLSPTPKPPRTAHGGTPDPRGKQAETITLAELDEEKETGLAERLLQGMVDRMDRAKARHKKQLDRWRQAMLEKPGLRLPHEAVVAIRKDDKQEAKRMRKRSNKGVETAEPAETDAGAEDPGDSQEEEDDPEPTNEGTEWISLGDRDRCLHRDLIGAVWRISQGQTPDRFWGALRDETRSWGKMSGRWLHPLLQELCWHWFGTHTVVLAPARHMTMFIPATHIREAHTLDEQASESACSWMALHIHTHKDLRLVLQTGRFRCQDQGVLLIPQRMLGSATIRSLFRDARWKASSPFTIEIECMWKRQRRLPRRRIQACLLWWNYQITPTLPIWLKNWSIPQGVAESLMAEPTEDILERPGIQDLLGEDLLSGWYPSEGEEWAQARRAGLTDAENSVAWQAMGRSTKEVSGVVAQVYLAQMELVCRIIATRKAMEDLINKHKQKLILAMRTRDGTQEEGQAAAAARELLQKPIFSQGRSRREVRAHENGHYCYPTAWAGAPQLGELTPLTKEPSSGEGTDEEAEAPGKRKPINRKTRSFHELLTLDETARALCQICGCFPSWQTLAGGLQVGGICRTCHIQLDEADNTPSDDMRCGNCGSDPRGQETFIAGARITCSACADWYVARAPRSRCWPSSQARAKHVREIIRRLLPQDDEGSELRVTVLSRALLRDHDHDQRFGGPSEIPSHNASMFRWHWLPHVVDLALRCQRNPDLGQPTPGTSVLTHNRREYKVAFWHREWAYVKIIRPDPCAIPLIWRQTAINDHMIRTDESGSSPLSTESVRNCFALSAHTAPYESGTESDTMSVEGGEVNDSEEKVCQYDCPYPVHEDLGHNARGGLRELYLCDACHQGAHWECLLRSRHIPAAEQEQLLDPAARWRCQTCVQERRFRVSYLVDSLTDNKGTELFIIRWSGFTAAADTVESRQALGKDYTGLQEQLRRRQDARADRGRDRYLKARHAHDCRRPACTRRWDGAGLEPGQQLWKEVGPTGISYHKWRLIHPATRPSLCVRSTPPWSATLRGGTSGRVTGKRLAEGLREHLRTTLTYRWYAESGRRDSRLKRVHKTKKCSQETATGGTDVTPNSKSTATVGHKHRFLGCPGVGTPYPEFSAAIAEELHWWPKGPARLWVDMQVTMSGSRVPVALDLNWVETVLHELQAHQIAVWAAAELAQMQSTYENMLSQAPGAVVLLRDRRQKERAEPRQQNMFEFGAVPRARSKQAAIGRITPGI